MSESQKTKKVIAQALIDLCGSEAFNKISVQDITHAAGLNRQTFYYHFSDKYALLRWIYQENAFLYLDTRDVNIDNWEEQALKMLKAIQEKRDFYYNTANAYPDIIRTDFAEVTKKLFLNLFEQMDAEHELLDEDKRFYARFLSYGCSGVLFTWIMEGYQETPLTIATQLFRLAKDIEFFSYRLYQQDSDDFM
ncbi:TetR/AcrR family transcriptional regulator [Enterococcus sp. LJL128]|uniref:TetR/AcrR family transcriptional regulator n=1 Tax=Enterococcus sp. LJL51 TaxID=3416656 RepID=UPI003CF797E6